jgi:hypothetical protein
MLTVLWFVSLPVLVVFLFRWGWKATPRWQRLCVLLGIPVIALMSLMDTAYQLGWFANVPEDSLVMYAVNILFYVYVISVMWGVLVGFAQTWMLIRALSPHAR